MADGEFKIGIYDPSRRVTPGVCAGIKAGVSDGGVVVRFGSGNAPGRGYVVDVELPRDAVAGLIAALQQAVAADIAGGRS